MPAAGLPVEIDFHNPAVCGFDFVPVLADIKFRAAMTARAGFFPAVQNRDDFNGPPAPDELPRQPRFTAGHAAGITGFRYWFEGLTDKSFGHVEMAERDRKRT